VLIDEAPTPDSSRYWDAERYEVGATPPSFDKQFVRDWLAGTSGWDRESLPPALPDEIVAQTRERYLTAFERLAGRPLLGSEQKE
jgi:phosphoribosylaminoimidazole-succinocarboxamide synthase